MSGNPYGQGGYGDFTGAAAEEPNGYGAAAAGNGYSAGESGAASTVKSNQSDGSIINSRDSPNNTKMFVGGISKNTNTASLRAYFEAFGVVRDIEIKIDSATGMSRGFGFVLFETEDSVNAVCQTREHFLDGKKIDPKRAEKRNAKIFCGGLKPDTDDETIKGIFSQYGEIELYERRMDKMRGTPQAFCFITFKDDAVAQRICKEKWIHIGDKRCECKIAVENKQKLYGQDGGYGGYGGGGYGQSWGAGGGPYGGYGGGRGRGGGRGAYGGGRGGSYGAAGGYGQQGGDSSGYGAQAGYGGGAEAGGYQGGQGGGAWGAGWGPNANPYSGGYGNAAGGAAGGRGGGPMRGGAGGSRGRGRPTPY